MDKPPRVTIPPVIKLDDGFADPSTYHPSIAAVFRQCDGSRVEVAVRDASDAYLCDGPRIDRHQLLVSTPGDRMPNVVVVQLNDLRHLAGVPEVLIALERFAVGDLKGAVRYVSAAGPRWAPLIDLLGGPG
ncbi:MAG: hypothetical protein KC468_10045 [Myxococcales bacterium]|nr:hypothetical protein [Myxococcales bacterium]